MHRSHLRHGVGQVEANGCADASMQDWPIASPTDDLAFDASAEARRRTPRAMPRWVRAAVIGTAVATLPILSASASSAQAADYDFASVYSSGVVLPQFTATLPSLNSSGTIAFAELFFDPSDGQSNWVVVESDGTQLLPVLNLTDTFGTGSPFSLVVNDAGAIAVNYSMGPRAVIVRIDVGGSVTVLAAADQGGSTPYREFPTTISMNSAGQVAALVTNQDATSSILRLDDSGVIEIARSSPALFNFSSPTINDAGVVAFKAQVPAPGFVRVYTGSGGPLTDEGTADPCVSASSFAPVINDDGFVLSDCGAPPLFTARGGIVNVLVTGTEDPIFAQLASSYSVDNRGLPAFVTGPGGSSKEVGLFTGNDPVGNKVVRTGDLVFGFPVEGIRMGYRSINDGGQIAFVLQVGDGSTVTSHIVRASLRRTPQTIAFAALPDRTFGDPPFTASATASSGLPITFSVTGTCSIAGDLVTITGAGSCTVTASQIGDANCLPAPDVSRTFAIAPAAQTVSFASLPDRTLLDSPFAVSAAASSGLAVAFSAGGSCSVAGDTVTLAGTGSCTLTASQAGSANYLPAPDVAQSFLVTRASQTITFAALPDRTLGDARFTVAATASSGLPVGFSAAGACTVTGSTVTITGAGSCTVTASQPGDATYDPAPEVPQTFAIARAAQTIGFGPLPDRTFGDPPFTVSAAASSGLPVTFAQTGNCSVAGDVVSIIGAGSCTVTASQEGDANYLPAAGVSQTFSIARASQTVSLAPLPDRTLGHPPFTVSASASSGLPVTFIASGACTVAGATVTLTAVGTCTVTASQAGDANYAPAPEVADSFWISGVILEARFDAGADGFSYVDDAFRSTGQAGYASGSWIASGDFRGGALQVSLGGINNNDILGMSGGWQTTFSLSAPTKVVLYVRGNLTQAPDYESDERSQLLVSVDGVLTAAPPNDYLAQIVGNGNGGSARTTGWRLFQLNLGTLNAGTHTLVIGGYNNKKTSSNESTTVLIDDVLLMDATPGAQAAVAALDFERFKKNIEVLADFGDRTQGTASNIDAGIWLENELEAAGYTVERHRYTYLGASRENIYATKVGTIFPDQMYIISAHMDGRGGGGAADDDASGCSLVLEAARALAGLQTAVSVRFIFWNNEETGLNGSTAYVNERVSQQGVENPPGSGIYPEPRWLGMIQHDMILFDHGLPPQPDQILGADIDVEYQASSTYANQSLQLANALLAGNQTHSTDYPGRIGSNMRYTDSWPFRNYTAAVSVRENQRVAEIGNGSNPHWHQRTDVYTTYSEADFRLGFNAVQMTLGTVAELAGAMIVP